VQHTVASDKMKSLFLVAASVATLSALGSAQLLRAGDASADEPRDLMNTITRYNWKLCDQCSGDPNNMCVAAGIIKGRKMRRSCDFSPCDPNNSKVNQRGWFCAKNTDAVLMPQGSKQDARRAARRDNFLLQPSHPANLAQGALFIPPQQAVHCVPCKSTAGWCDPFDGTACDGSATCAMCDVLFPDSPTLAGRGWLCNAKSTDSPEVCVNNDGFAIVNITQFLVVDAAGNVTGVNLTPKSFASTIAKKSCKDTPFCLWGSIAGAVLVTIVTLGFGLLAEGAAGAAAAGGAAGAAVIEGAGDAAAAELLTTSIDSLMTISVESVEMTQAESDAYFMRLGNQMMTQMFLAE
jgi:hypothetical protein